MVDEHFVEQTQHGYWTLILQTASISHLLRAHLQSLRSELGKEAYLHPLSLLFSCYQMLHSIKHLEDDFICEEKVKLTVEISSTYSPQSLLVIYSTAKEKLSTFKLIYIFFKSGVSI